jgi:outer membrane biogenesis lipoprotein LolB
MAVSIPGFDYIIGSKETDMAESTTIERIVCAVVASNSVPTDEKYIERVMMLSTRLFNEIEQFNARGRARYNAEVHRAYDNGTWLNWDKPNPYK